MEDKKSLLECAFDDQSTADKTEPVVSIFRPSAIGGDILIRTEPRSSHTRVRRVVVVPL